MPTETGMRWARGWLLLACLAAAGCLPAATPAPVESVVRPSATRTTRPSPVPATSTAVPTATLAPAEREFTQEFEGGLPYWEFLQAGAAHDPLTPMATGGALRLELTAAYDWAYALYEAHLYADVRVEARVEFEAAGEVSAGVICRYDPALGWYEFNIHADQTYALLFGQWLQEGIARYTPLVVSRSEEITPTENEISLECVEDKLTPHINGIQIRTRQEKLHVLTEGKVGVSAASFGSAPLGVSYDWIRVGIP